MIRSISVMCAVVEKKRESTNDKGASMKLTPYIVCCRFFTTASTARFWD